MFMKNHLEQMKYMLELKGYMPSTQETYLSHLRLFMESFDEPTETLSFEHVRSYLHGIIERGLSAQYLNSIYSAIKFFYETVLAKDWDIRHIPRLKKDLIAQL